MDTTRRGNYESGSDYVREDGELRFTSTSVISPSASSRRRSSSGSSPAALAEEEREDLVNLAVNGEVGNPHSGSAST